jgi:hypothetical protein
MNRSDGKEAADEMLHNSTALVSLKFKNPAPSHNFSEEHVTCAKRHENVLIARGCVTER